MSKDRVLIVDDELDNRVMMRYFLESWGYEVELASNGEEALGKLDDFQPALILLDLEMPVMDGFETCHRLKENPETENIPVIMFTGLEATADKVKGLRRGADDYVVKTVDPEEIQARIEMILRRFRRFEAQAASKPAEAEGGGSSSDAVINGSLDEKHFPEALQLVLAYGQSGTFLVQNGEEEGRVYLKNGDVAHAEYGDLEGEEAFFELSLWNSGHFSYQVGETDTRTTIKQSGTSLLMEATRRMDEWNLISSKIPSFDAAPHRIALAGSESIRLTREDWKILQQVDGQRTIRQIVDSIGCDIFDAGRTVFGLLTVGVLALDGESPGRDTWFDAVPELREDPKGEEPFELSARQWKLLSYIDGERDLGDLTNLVGLSPRAMAEALKELAEKGFVRVNKNGKARGGSESVRAAASPNEATLEPTGGKVEAFQPRIRAIGFER